MFKKILLIILVCLLALILGGAVFLYSSYRSGKLQKFVWNTAFKSTSSTTNIGGSAVDSEILKKVLGIDSPQYYLLLFLNNTEIRPGGGFIGSYAVLKMENGQPQILKVEGTETLDLSAQPFESQPPKVLADNLKIKTWQFRDSNWSPDFAVSSEKALELYKKENGLEADKIQAVIGITPTVFEGILNILGPVKINGEEFNAQNFTEKLEYEVEYGYKNKNQDFNERKSIMSGLSGLIMSKFKSDLIFNWSKYYVLGEQMIKEKQLLFYAVDPETEKLLSDRGWDGKIKNTSGDYLEWVDANLGAWKTDASINRSLTYKISPTDSGKFLAVAQMNYDHIGKIDWRTSRYLSYARIYVPVGAELIEVVSGGQSIDNKQIESGQELGKQWFGTTIEVPPQKNKDLVFKFYLSPEIVNQINLGSYNLLIQKQPGIIENNFTLDLDFGKKILTASPAEDQKNWGDNKYNFNTHLKTDSNFAITVSR